MLTSAKHDILTTGGIYNEYSSHCHGNILPWWQLGAWPYPFSFCKGSGLQVCWKVEPNRPFLSLSRLKPSLLLLLCGRGQSHAPCSEHVKPLFVAQQFFTLRSHHFKSLSSAAITVLHHHPHTRVYDDVSFIAKWCHHVPVTVKMDPPKLVPPGTINKD